MMPQLTRKLGGQPSQNKHRKLVTMQQDGKKEEDDLDPKSVS